VKLVADWRKAWRWFSVQGLALLAVAPVIYESFPEMQSYLSEGQFRAAMGILAFLTILGRVVKQGS
jgi:hypothetical protein